MNPNQPRNIPEVIQDASIEARVAYNGLWQAIHERRAAGAVRREAAADRSTGFYDDLSRITDEEVTSGTNAATPPTVSNTFAKQTAAQGIYRDALSLGTADPSVLNPSAAEPTLNVPPQTLGERRAAIKAAKKIDKIKDMRKDQKSRVGTFGHAGYSSHWRRGVMKVTDRFRTNIDLQRGTIDPFEARKRQNSRRAINPTKTPWISTRTEQVLDYHQNKLESFVTGKQKKVIKKKQSAIAAQQRHANKAAEHANRKAHAEALRTT